MTHVRPNFSSLFNSSNLPFAETTNYSRKCSWRWTARRPDDSQGKKQWEENKGIDAWILLQRFSNLAAWWFTQYLKELNTWRWTESPIPIACDVPQIKNGKISIQSNERFSFWYSQLTTLCFQRSLIVWTHNLFLHNVIISPAPKAAKWIVSSKLTFSDDSLKSWHRYLTGVCWA